MHAAVFTHLEQADVFIGVAAVADYGIKNPSASKQKKAEGQAIGLEMAFELNPDILAEVGLQAQQRRAQQHGQQRDKPLLVVGFAA